MAQLSIISKKKEYKMNFCFMSGAAHALIDYVATELYGRVLI